MSWLDDFEDELVKRRVRPASRERLRHELADHIACEQGAPTRLGDPRAIAGQYADELSSDDARRGSLGIFAALALTGGALLVQQLTLGRIGYPGFDHGYSTVLALVAILAMVLGSQVALVCGCLAGWRAVRRRAVAVLPAAEIALLHRRAAIAVAAGAVTATGMMLYMVDFVDVLPALWLVLSGTLCASATAALAIAWRGQARGAATVALAAGPAGDVFDDVPPLRALRDHPLGLWALATLAVGGFVTLFEWHAERALAEGLQRGGFEALALGVCFALFGRAIGARR
jgi:hypothetical protein